MPKQWTPMVKLAIAADEKFIGPGCRDLLRLIHVHGSVRLASEAMGLSYSKAWRILNTLEGQLGYPVVARLQGGRSGGESKLTGEGALLLRRFEAYEAECMRAVDEIFCRHFAREAGMES